MSTQAAQTFLRAFRKATALGRPVDAFSDDVDGLSAALLLAPEEMGDAMKAAADAAGGEAIISTSMFAAAACDADGKLLVCDETFAAWNFSEEALIGAVRVAGPNASHLSAILDDMGGRPVAVTIAELVQARQWPLSNLVRASLESGAAKFAILGVRSTESSAWAQVLEAWRFSPSESRLALALVRTGDLRESAKQIGLSYETARELVAAAMAKTGAKKQPEFVQHLVSMVVGDLPSNDMTWRIFADAFGLSNRQGRLAQLIALGATRSSAAGILKISDQSAKGDLKIIFENCGVKKGAGLARIVAEIDALARLASATQIEIHTEGAMTEPLRFIRRRRAPGRIALSDYGPADGKPVIVFHALFAGRHLPRVLVRALHAQGVRPISVERPGFGLTSPADSDVFEDTNADLIDVLDALDIGRTSILGRCSVFPLAFASAHPDRFEHGVLLQSLLAPGMNPLTGLYGAAFRLLQKQPHLVSVLVQMLINNSSAKAVVKLIGRSIANCPADVATFSDPQNRRDFVRSARQISSPLGVVREFALQIVGPVVPHGARDLNWTVLCGGQDGMAEGQDGTVGWKDALPRARMILIPEAGRFLHMSHPTVVAEALGRHPRSG